jgi:hypothetical protein
MIMLDAFRFKKIHTHYVGIQAPSYRLIQQLGQRRKKSKKISSEKKITNSTNSVKGG